MKDSLGNIIRNPKTESQTKTELELTKTRMVPSLNKKTKIKEQKTEWISNFPYTNYITKI